MSYSTIEAEMERLATLATDGRVPEAEVYASSLRLRASDLAPFSRAVVSRWRVRRASEPLV